MAICRSIYQQFFMCNNLKNEKVIAYINTFSFHFLDIIGILVQDFGLDTNYRSTMMRDLAITERSKETIVATIWKNEAQNFIAERFTVIIIRRGQVVEYEGKRKINCLFGTLVWVIERFILI